VRFDVSLYDNLQSELKLVERKCENYINECVTFALGGWEKIGVVIRESAAESGI
jgi:hypothetical protein